ncbi:unnamed protein product, partial [Mesorhabditis belari]|uniref:F-box domain-containing protein n=1 Tax=Mesorhabditis belari TaxID=2138241 RepID=A0AAF3ELS9_9BILA
MSSSMKRLKRRKRKSIEKADFKFIVLPFELQKSIVNKLGVIDRLEFGYTAKNCRKLVASSGLLPTTFIGFEFNPVDKDSDSGRRLVDNDDGNQRLLYNFHSRTPRKRDDKVDSVEIFVSPNGNNEIKFEDLYRKKVYPFKKSSESRKFLDKILEKTRFRRLSFTGFIRCSLLSKIECKFDRSLMGNFKFHFPAQEVKFELFSESVQGLMWNFLDIETEKLTIYKKGFFNPRGASYCFNVDLTKELIEARLFKSATSLYITGDLFEAEAIPFLLNRPHVDLNISVRPFISSIQSLLCQALPQNVREAIFTSTYTENHFMIKGILDLMGEAQKRLKPLSNEDLPKYLNADQLEKYEKKYLYFLQRHDEKEFLWMVLNVGHGAKYHRVETGKSEKNEKKNKGKPSVVIKAPAAESIVEGSSADEDVPRSAPQSSSNLNFALSANEKASEKRRRRLLNFYLVSSLLLSSICILVLLICIAGMGFWVHQTKAEIQETHDQFKEVKERLDSLLAQKDGTIQRNTTQSESNFTRNHQHNRNNENLDSFPDIGATAKLIFSLVYPRFFFL